MLHVLDKDASYVTCTGTFHKQANYEELNLTAQCSLCIVKLKKHVRVFERVYQIQLFYFKLHFLHLVNNSPLLN